jgi:hypothetical protein
VLGHGSTTTNHHAQGQLAKIWSFETWMTISTMRKHIVGLSGQAIKQSSRNQSAADLLLIANNEHLFKTASSLGVIGLRLTGESNYVISKRLTMCPVGT